MIDNQTSATVNSPVILWESVLPSGTLTVTNETADGPGANALTQATNEVWECASSTGTLSFVFGASQTLDCVGLAKHTLSGRTVYVERYNGSSWVAAATMAVTDSEATMAYFTAASSTQWRIRVTGGTFTLGVAYLGAALVMPGVIQVPHTPLNLCEEVRLLDGSISRNGQFMSSEIEMISGRADLAFEVQLPDFVVDDFDGFRQWFNRGNAFFIACAPDAWPLDMAYCWRDGADIVPPWRDAVYMDVGMGVRVYRG